MLAFAATGTTAALAEDSGDEEQLLDVSKQVGDIEEKLNKLLSGGRWARTGELLAGADCGFGEPSRLFAPWGDHATYTLAPPRRPLGDRQSGRWTRRRRSFPPPIHSAVPGSLSRARQGRRGGDTGHVRQPRNHPDDPLLHQGPGSRQPRKSRLEVAVLYEDFSGHVKHLKIAKLRASSEWRSSIVVPMYMNKLALASPEGLTAVAFRFKAQGLQKNETLSISSLYVDPFRNR